MYRNCDDFVGSSKEKRLKRKDKSERYEEKIKDDFVRDLVVVYVFL